MWLLKLKIISLLALLQAKFDATQANGYTNIYVSPLPLATPQKMHNDYIYMESNPNPICPSGGIPVCATNGQQHYYFANDCKLEDYNTRALFEGHLELMRTDLQSCIGDCMKIACSKISKPICAVPEGQSRLFGETFINECELKRGICLSRLDWHILHVGPCAPKPYCPQHCPLQYKPICAQWNYQQRTFSNECQLKYTICSTQEDWQILYKGECSVNSFAPLPFYYTPHYTHSQVYNNFYHNGPEMLQTPLAYNRQTLMHSTIDHNVHHIPITYSANSFAYASPYGVASGINYNASKLLTVKIQSNTPKLPKYYDYVNVKTTTKLPTYSIHPLYPSYTTHKPYVTSTRTGNTDTVATTAAASTDVTAYTAIASSGVDISTPSTDVSTTTELTSSTVVSTTTELTSSTDLLTTSELTSATDVSTTTELTSSTDVLTTTELTSTTDVSTTTEVKLSKDISAINDVSLAPDDSTTTTTTTTATTESNNTTTERSYIKAYSIRPITRTTSTTRPKLTYKTTKPKKCEQYRYTIENDGPARQQISYINPIYHGPVYNQPMQMPPYSPYALHGFASHIPYPLFTPPMPVQPLPQPMHVPADNAYYGQTNGYYSDVVKSCIQKLIEFLVPNQY